MPYLLCVSFLSQIPDCSHLLQLVRNKFIARARIMCVSTVCAAVQRGPLLFVPWTGEIGSIRHLISVSALLQPSWLERVADQLRSEIWLSGPDLLRLLHSRKRSSWLLMAAGMQRKNHHKVLIIVQSDPYSWFRLPYFTPWLSV